MMDSDVYSDETERSEDECPRCGSEGIQNPILDDWYECNRCLIAFSADGEVDEGE
jgi:ribosomal protein S27AE